MHKNYAIMSALSEKQTFGSLLYAIIKRTPEINGLC
ncbi:hypothetical protein LEJE111609_00295 [Lelliottia jeotgali]